MKKALSLFLAVFMALSCIAPAFAAETHTVTFVSPQTVEKDAYYFIAVDNSTGALAQPFVESEKYRGTEYGYVCYVFVYDEKNPDADPTYRQADPNNEEELTNGTYVLYSNILRSEDKALFDDTRYLPQCYETDEPLIYNKGDMIIFGVMTNEKYDPLTVVVTVNGEDYILPKDTEEYVLQVGDEDLVIAVREIDDTIEDELDRRILLPNHYSVTLTTGEGYSVKPPKGENNKVVYYGETFDFRVKVNKGYTANDMKVTLIPRNEQLEELIGEEGSVIEGVIGNENIICQCVGGPDEDGCYLYSSPVGITKNYMISVSNVQKESSAGIMALLKRILRLILDILGIDTSEISFLKDLVTYYDVDIDTSGIANTSINYEIVTSAQNDSHATDLQLLSGEGITIKFEKTNEIDNVSVKIDRHDGNAPEYRTDLVWTAHYDIRTGDTTWTSSCYISSITSATSISIEQ